MATVFSALGFILFALITIIAFAFIILFVQYLMWFRWRECKHCNHKMEYKGLREDDANGHFLFHCPHCGAWEKIPKEEFFRNLDRGFNPNEQ